MPSTFAQGTVDRGGASMQLIRFDGNKTGLVVELASGIHVVDVIASVGALVPDDPISHGILNGLLKTNGSWAQLL
jgi:hypothetical protein